MTGLHMKTIKSLILVGFIMTGLNALAMDDIAKQASDATAKTLTVAVQGAAAIVGCTMVAKGIKAGVPYLNAIDNDLAAPYITGACTALYASYMAMAARENAMSRSKKDTEKRN